MENTKDILDEDFDGDLDAELAEVDQMLSAATPVVYLGELVDEDLKNKFEIYACTEIILSLEEGNYTLFGKAIDVGSDDMFEVDPVQFETLEEVVKYLKTKKLHNCPIDLESLLAE